MIDYSELGSRKGTPGLEKSGHTSTFTITENIEKISKLLEERSKDRNTVGMYMGVPIEEFGKEALIQIVYEVLQERDSQAEGHRRSREMDRMFARALSGR